ARRPIPDLSPPGTSLPPTQMLRPGSPLHRRPLRAAPDLSRRTRTRRTAWLRVQAGRSLRNVRGTRTQECRSTAAPAQRLILHPPISSRVQATVPGNLRGAARLTQDPRDTGGEPPATPQLRRGDSCAARAFLRTESRESRQETEP